LQRQIEPDRDDVPGEDKRSEHRQPARRKASASTASGRLATAMCKRKDSKLAKGGRLAAQGCHWRRIAILDRRDARIARLTVMRRQGAPTQPSAALGQFRILPLAHGGGELPLAVLALAFRPRWLACSDRLSSPGTSSGLALSAAATAELAGGAVADAEADAAPRLKVVSANVWYRNDGIDAAIHYLEIHRCRLVGLIEVTPQWLTALQPLYAKYPYRIDCMQSMPPAR